MNKNLDRAVGVGRLDGCGGGAFEIDDVRAVECQSLGHPRQSAVGLVKLGQHNSDIPDVVRLGQIQIGAGNKRIQCILKLTITVGRGSCDLQGPECDVWSGFDLFGFFYDFFFLKTNHEFLACLNDIDWVLHGPFW